MRENEKEALELLERGYSIIPVRNDKKPYIPWTEYQKRLPTEKEIKKWFTLYPEANIGIVTGEVSGLVVVDVEKDGSTEGLTPTLFSKSGGGGWHYYYKHPGFVVNNSARKIRELVDIRGDGGYIIAPPSLHASGNKYEWRSSFEDLTDLPDWLLEELEKDSKVKTNWHEFSQDINPVGARNDSAAKYIGYLLSKSDLDLWEAKIWQQVVSWNKEKNVPPLDEKELRSVFESISKIELSKRESGEQTTKKERKITESTQIVHEMEKIGVIFHNQYEAPFIQVEINGHKEIFPISARNRKFNSFANKVNYEIFGKTLAESKLKEVAGLLRAKAIFEGNMYELSNRMVRKKSNEIWLDMCDDKWRAIKITDSSWSVVENPPILFIKYEHSKCYLDPVVGGDIKLLNKYLNFVDQDYIILVYAFLVSILMSNLPVPGLIVHGLQGSSKTTLLKMLRLLIDPSVNNVLDFSNNKKELIQMFDHNRVCFFDNLTYLTSNHSDLLCKAITGFAHTSRELFSDNNDVLRDIQCAIGINGINNVVTKPDLLERSIVLECAQILPKDRKTESDIWEEFEKDRPAILGGLLDLTVAVLKLLPSIKKNDMKRMADYTLIGKAVAIYLDMEPDEFVSVYEKNILEANGSAIQNDKLADTILHLFDDVDETEQIFEPSAMYEYLTNLARRKFILGDENKSDYAWPKDAVRMSKKLTIITPLLATYGIDIIKSRDQRKRSIIFRTNSKFIKNDTDDTNDTNFENILNLL
ncbi:MAG: bifunctional DNA primase/polymerase [Candidatus Magasanikbacteria bacterium]